MVSGIPGIPRQALRANDQRYRCRPVGLGSLAIAVVGNPLARASRREGDGGSPWRGVRHVLDQYSPIPGRLLPSLVGYQGSLDQDTEAFSQLFPTAKYHYE
jgi:hypothetical protein